MREREKRSGSISLCIVISFVLEVRLSKDWWWRKEKMNEKKVDEWIEPCIDRMNEPFLWAMSQQMLLGILDGLTDYLSVSVVLGPTRPSSTSWRTGLWWFWCGFNWTRKTTPSQSWILPMGSVDLVGPRLLFLCPISGLQFMCAQCGCQIAKITQKSIRHRLSSTRMSTKRGIISRICWPIPYFGYRRSWLVHWSIVSIAPFLPLLFWWPFTIPVPTLSSGQIFVCFKCWPTIPSFRLIYGPRIFETWIGVDSTFNDWRWMVDITSIPAPNIVPSKGCNSRRS